MKNTILKRVGLGSLLLMTLFASQANAQMDFGVDSRLQIVSANYQYNDVTFTAQRICDAQYSDTCVLVPTDTLGYDPDYGRAKFFEVNYRCSYDQTLQTARMNPVVTGAPLYLSCNPNRSVRILQAEYRNIDVTSAAQNLCNSYSMGDRGCQIVPSQTLSYDPDYGNAKLFNVTYECRLTGETRYASMYPVVTGAILDLNCGYSPQPNPIPPRPIPVPPRPIPVPPRPIPVPPRPIPVPPRPIPVPPRPIPVPPRPIPVPPRPVPIPVPPRPVPAPLPQPRPGGQCPPGTHMDPRLGRCVAG